MGATESASIRINYNRSNAFYYAGEIITGSISMTNMKSKMNSREAYIEFIGELTSPTPSTRLIQEEHGRTRKENYIEPNRVIFWRIQVPITRPIQSKNSFSVSLSNSSQSWPFQVTLPDSLPPTLVASTEREPHVKYYARMILDSRDTASTTAPIYPLTVSPRVHLSSMSGAQAPVSFARHNRKHIDFHGTLPSGGIIPGQNVSLYYRLQNPKQAEIKRIDALLVQHRQIGGIRSDHIIFRNTLPGIHKFEDTFLEQQIDLLVPHGYLPPTHNYTTSNAGVSMTVFVHYEIIFKVKVSGVFADFEVNIPVIMGTHMSPSPQLYNSTKDYPSIQYSKGGSDPPPPPPDDDLPPSYDVAMSISKKS